ncbi:hypothetical protein N566_17840, partial [Streptomycetaceae bacterium MP113-05]
TALTSGEHQLAIHQGELNVPRLAALTPSADGDGAGFPVLGNGTVLVTGGTGTLGALVARHLVSEHGVRRLLLAGRRGAAAPGTDELMAELTALGADVTVSACDVADRKSLAGLLAAVPAAHPLTAVVHTAGVVEDGLLEGLAPEAVQRVMAPKATAAWMLHELTRDLPLTAFVLFSSFAGKAGAAGQAAYAAANAFLDALARHRHAEGLPAHSLAWGLWEPASGITAGLSSADLARIARSGIAPLPPTEALALLDAALRTGHPVLAPVRLTEPRALRAHAAAGDLPPLLARLALGATARTRSGERRRAARGDEATAQGLVARLSALPEAEQNAELLEFVGGHVAEVLGQSDATQIEPDRGFQELGFDSLTAMELRNRLQKATGVRLPATLAFDFPDTASVAAHLRSLLDLDSTGRTRALLGELDRLAESLSSLSEHSGTGSSDRARITIRLRSLLAGWNEDSSDGPSKDADEDGGERRDLDTATDDDLFHLVENLGNA